MDPWIYAHGTFGELSLIVAGLHFFLVGPHIDDKVIGSHPQTTHRLILSFCNSPCRHSGFNDYRLKAGRIEGD